MTDRDVANAEAEVAAARQRLTATAATLKARLAPAALARDAGEKLKEAGSDLAQSGVDAVKRHPLPVAGIIAAIGAFLARKPLARLFRRKPAQPRTRRRTR